jgi:hypothetical protein
MYGTLFNSLPGISLSEVARTIKAREREIMRLERKFNRLKRKNDNANDNAEAGKVSRQIQHLQTLNRIGRGRSGSRRKYIPETPLFR